VTTTARFIVTVSLAWAIFICWIALVVARPLPVPSTAGICPSGYTHSPTSGYCTPNPNTTRRAVPKDGYRGCPPGYHDSMGAFCVETPGR
jgi:hypothetical protein